MKSDMLTTKDYSRNTGAKRFGKGKWIVLIALVVLALLYVVFCAIYKKVKYDPYVKACENFMLERKNREDYQGFVAGASPSEKLFRFSGNLSITQTVLFNREDGKIVNDTVDLIIWPRLFGRIETRVQIQTVDGKGYAFLLDEDMNLIEKSDENQKWFDQYRDVIAKEYQIAHEVFGIYNVK